MHKLSANSTGEEPVAIDLFSGCGGLTEGLKMAGFRVLAAIDVDLFAIQTYRANHREVAVWKRDVRRVEPARLLRRFGLRKGQLDLVAGCPPCQGFSTLRTRNGSSPVNDPRNDLLLEFQRFVEELLPRAVMMENVPPLVRDRRFGGFTQKLRQLGYVGHHSVLDAADYGVPQRRRRLIYLAGYCAAIPFATEITDRRTVQDALGQLPKAGSSGDAVHDLPERRSAKVMRIIRSIPKDGGSRVDLPEELQLPCHKRCDGFADVYGRMAWRSVAPTITSGCFNPSKGRFLHPEEDRAITMREAALLQGFPQRYKFTSLAGKEALAGMIGNALPPPFVAAHADSIRRFLADAESWEREVRRMGFNG
ncbi:MAG: DNA cytosine methyltransferase [Gemmatimonadetes bacterium]|nr:DNA cytosine methyltransferase [Gemmatimonadota bacterium]